MRGNEVSDREIIKAVLRDLPVAALWLVALWVVICALIAVVPV